MVTRLLAWGLLSAGAGGGLLLGLPALALAVAPWVGLALVLAVLVAGGVALVKVRADYEYRCFHDALQAETAWRRACLDAGRHDGAIVDAPYYRVR